MAHSVRWEECRWQVTREKLGKHDKKLGSEMGENGRGVNQGARSGHERDFHNITAADDAEGM